MMTRRDVAQVLSMVRLYWPHSTIGDDPAEVTAAWFDALGDLELAGVEAALRKLRDSGREHAPPVGVIVREVALAAAAPAPGFDEVQAYLSRNVRLLPYGGDDRDTLAAVLNLTRAGAHEAVCRWVAEVGLYTARMTPDPTLQALDPNQLADRRDRARAYERRTVPAWEADPTPGRAVELVRRKAAQVEQRDAERVERAERRRLEAPEAELVEDDAPEDTGRNAVADFRRRQIERRMREDADRAERAEADRLEAEQQAAAEAELREHRARPEGSADA